MPETLHCRLALNLAAREVPIGLSVTVKEKESSGPRTAMWQVPGKSVSEIRHCRHCMDDCLGDCLLDEAGLCIHGWNEKPHRQFSWRLLLTRRLWHRVFWGYH